MYSHAVRTSNYRWADNLTGLQPLNMGRLGFCSAKLASASDRKRTNATVVSAAHQVRVTLAVIAFYPAAYCID